MPTISGTAMPHPKEERRADRFEWSRKAREIAILIVSYTWYD